MANEPTLEDVMKRQLVIEAKLDLLINSAKQGGGLVPQVDYVKLRKMRKRIRKRGITIKCKKECKKGPCRYGASQALKCFEQFEKTFVLDKKRKILAENIPYTKKQLDKFMRRDLLMLGGIVGVNIRKILKRGKGKGNHLLIDEIARLQPRWVKIKEKLNSKQRKKQEKEELNSILKQPDVAQGADNAEERS